MDIKCKRIMIYFIEATQKLIRTEGMDSLSIRKIANTAGYNSATLYNYFYDLEHLIMFGSVCYLREYVLALASSLNSEMTSKERFQTIYHCFNEIAFQNPDIFYHMFFGRYSSSLGEVLHTYYYELFPDELDGLGEPMKRMMVAGTMRERDSVTMQAMVEDGFVALEKKDMTLDLIIAVHQSFLYQAYIQNGELDIEKHKQKFNQLFEYLLEAAK